MLQLKRLNIIFRSLYIIIASKFEDQAKHRMITDRNVIIRTTFGENSVASQIGYSYITLAVLIMIVDENSIFCN